MRTLYLINLAFGLAGTERRMANVWRALRVRGNVRPILVVPDSMANILRRANLVDGEDDLLWTVPDSATWRAVARVRTKTVVDSVLAFARARTVAKRYAPIWERIRDDPNGVMHIGLNCSSLNPPPGPIVYECMDSTLRLLGNRHYIKAAARPSIIHCQTERIREALERTMAPRRPKWATVVSPMYFASYPRETSAQVARDPMLIAFVGRLVPEKHPLLFLEAFARARSAGLPCRGLMLGEGPLRGDVEAFIERHDLGSVIELGFIDNPADRLKTVALYVTLQTGDNYGSQSLLEAMGAGCAVIASDVGETARLVTNDVGIRVTFDASAIAQAIASILNDPHRRDTLGAAAAHVARTEYTADRYAAFLETVYQLAVERCRDAGSEVAFAKPTLT